MPSVGPCHFRSESASLGDVVKELSALSQLQDNEGPLLFLPLVELELGLEPMVDLIDEVRMLQLAQKLRFNLISRFLGCTASIDLQGKALPVLAAEINTA